METSLDKIIRNYVINELKHQRPERENGESGKRDRTSSDVGSDEEYIRVLHECLEKKGIMRELQAFLRQKMVLILQDKWPNLVSASPTELINPTVIKLLEDFLCSRKLLYTFSVLCSELGLKSSGKVKWGKMPCQDAEKLLEQIDIKKDSRLSRRILKFYSNKEDCSLLECIIQTTGWSESTSYPSEEEQIRLGFIKTNDPKKFASRLQQIDEFYDKKQSTNETVKNLGAEERFHAIERWLEDDKRVQLQMAIQKFKEEEVARIKEETEHKMKFEMLSKENELLLNYKEKAIILKDNFEREKALWLAEKSREEREMEEKRQELESMITSVSKTKDNNVLLLSPKTQAESDGPVKKVVSEQIEANLTKHYEKVDDFLMREAELRLAVKRLKEENAKLLEEKERQRQQKLSQAIAMTNSVQFQHETLQKPDSVIQKIDNDKVAFLQYNLEHQAEEIKRLKQQLCIDSQKRVVDSSPSSTKLHEKDSNDLLTFLAESKRRCEEIEEDVKSVDNKLHAIQNRRSRSSSPAYHPYPQQQPTSSSGPYSTFTKMLIDQIEPLNLPHQLPIIHPPVIMPRPQSFRTRSKNEPVSFEGQLRPLKSPTIASIPEIPLDQDSTRNDAQMVLRNIQQPQAQTTNSLHEDQRNSYLKENLPDRTNSVKPTEPQAMKIESRRASTTLPEILEEISPKERKRKKSDSEKVEKAVRKGALSFEKVSSDDGESSMSSSIRHDLSSSRSRSRSKVQRSELQMAQKRVNGAGESIDQIPSEISNGKKSDPEDITGDNDKSLPASAGYDISHGESVQSVDDDDFWKI